jgi:hypothetical protein
MRGVIRQLPFALLLCSATACFPAGVQHGHHHHHHDRDAELVGAIVYTGFVVANAIAQSDREERAQVYVAPMPMCAEFDRGAARTALATTMYKDCGQGGDGHVIVTFSADGTVSSARIEDGDYSDDTEACIVGRFESIRMAPYCGSFHRVRWQITLPESM